MVNTHWQIYYENTSIMFNSCINRTAVTILSIQHSRPSKGKLRFVEETLPHNPPGTTVIGDRLRVASQFCKCAVFLYLGEICIVENTTNTIMTITTITTTTTTTTNITTTTTTPISNSGSSIRTDTLRN